MGVAQMSQDEKIREAQSILDWVITNLNGRIKCQVLEYKYENYRVQFFNKDNKLIMPTQIPEEWIKGSNPKDNLIHDNLKMLLRNLENYQ
jgi:hypothetical protein